MYEYLKFPEKNRVGKKLSKSKYVKRSNATEGERKYVAAYLQYAEILYSFQFNDGEVIVLLVDYFAEECDKYTLHNFVKAIAQSIPYKILLIVKSEGTIRFFTFDERINTRDDNRSLVNSMHSSMDIIPIENGIDANIILNAFRSAIGEAKTAKELYGLWDSVLAEGESGEHDNIIVDDTFKYSREKYNTISNAQRALALLTEKDYNGENENTCILYEGEPLDIDGEIEHKLFVEFCAYYSRKLLNRARIYKRMDDEEWVPIYLDGCNSYADNIFKCVLNDKCISIIASAFWHNYREYEESSYHYDVAELKEHIGIEYFSFFE